MYMYMHYAHIFKYVGYIFVYIIYTYMYNLVGKLTGLNKIE